MHFAEDHVESKLFIREYREGQFLKTNEGEFSSAIVLFNDQTLQNCLPQTVNELTEAHFQMLADLKPELILLGTGASQIFPAMALMDPIFKKRIGIEVMNTHAACRTFNLLLSEGRSVLAALFV